MFTLGIMNLIATNKIIMSDDAQLVDRVAQEDREAFLKLYDRYSARIHGLAMYMLRDTMAAEEVTQDAFLKLWTRADTYRANQGTLLNWLLTITRRLVIDRIRMEKRRPPIDDRESDDTWREASDPESETDEFRWRSLRFAVDELPIEQRQVIELAYYYSLSQSQISEHLGIPLGTVKTRVRLGMAKLREAIKQPSKV
jgi:RNA polymerase sigma-70 factor, ECF subfamily